jgi:hypothetical protein
VIADVALSHPGEDVTIIIIRWFSRFGARIFDGGSVIDGVRLQNGSVVVDEVDRVLVDRAGVLGIAVAVVRDVLERLVPGREGIGILGRFLFGRGVAV